MSKKLSHVFCRYITKYRNCPQSDNIKEKIPQILLGEEISGCNTYCDNYIPKNINNFGCSSMTEEVKTIDTKIVLDEVACDIVKGITTIANQKINNYQILELIVNNQIYIKNDKLISKYTKEKNFIYV